MHLDSSLHQSFSVLASQASPATGIFCTIFFVSIASLCYHAFTLHSIPMNRVVVIALLCISYYIFRVIRFLSSLFWLRRRLLSLFVPLAIYLPHPNGCMGTWSNQNRFKFELRFVWTLDVQHTCNTRSNRSNAIENGNLLRVKIGCNFLAEHLKCATGSVNYPWRLCIEIKFWLIRLYQMHSTECSTINRLICAFCAFCDDGTVPHPQHTQSHHSRCTTCLNLVFCHRWSRRRHRFQFKSCSIVRTHPNLGDNTEFREPTNDLWIWIWWYSGCTGECDETSVCILIYSSTFDCGVVQLLVSSNTTGAAHSFAPATLSELVASTIVSSGV